MEGCGGDMEGGGSAVGLPVEGRGDALGEVGW